MSALHYHSPGEHTSRRQRLLPDMACNSDASAASTFLYGAGQDSKMTQPPIQHQYFPVEYPQEMPGWRQHQQQHQNQNQSQNPPHKYTSYPVESTNTGSTPASQSQFWESSSNLASSFVWQNSLPMDPFTVSKSESSIVTNSNLDYRCTNVRSLWDNSEAGFGSESSWPSSCTVGHPSRDSVNNSNMSMDTSHSRDSFFGETMDCKSYTLSPGLSIDHASPATDWSTISSVFSPATEGTSPGSFSSLPMLVSTQTLSNADPSINSFEGRPHSGVGRTTAIVGSPNECHQQGPARFTLESGPYCGSVYSHSQNSSPGATPWYPPGYSPGFSGLPRSPYGDQCNYVTSHKHTNMFNMNEDTNAKQRQIQWTGFVTEVPELEDAAQNADEDAKRKTDDEILIKCKADGITYKEIKKRLRTKVAESTLRGRYRALTKPRKDRVRKPVWTENDITLLKEIVQRELRRIDRRDPSLNQNSRLSKVQWMKVVEHIEIYGSYRFGVATAKKKWIEVSGDGR